MSNATGVAPVVFCGLASQVPVRPGPGSTTAHVADKYRIVAGRLEPFGYPFDDREFSSLVGDRIRADAAIRAAQELRNSQNAYDRAVAARLYAEAYLTRDLLNAMLGFSRDIKFTVPPPYVSTDLGRLPSGSQAKARAILVAAHFLSSSPEATPEMLESFLASLKLGQYEYAALQNLLLSAVNDMDPMYAPFATVAYAIAAIEAEKGNAGGLTEARKKAVELASVFYRARSGDEGEPVREVLRQRPWAMEAWRRWEESAVSLSQRLMGGFKVGNAKEEFGLIEQIKLGTVPAFPSVTVSELQTVRRSTRVKGQPQQASTRRYSYDPDAAANLGTVGVLFADTAHRVLMSSVAAARLAPLISADCVASGHADEVLQAIANFAEQAASVMPRHADLTGDKGAQRRMDNAYRALAQYRDCIPRIEVMEAYLKRKIFPDYDRGDDYLNGSWAPLAMPYLFMALGFEVDNENGLLSRNLIAYWNLVRLLKDEQVKGSQSQGSQSVASTVKHQVYVVDPESRGQARLTASQLLGAWRDPSPTDAETALRKYVLDQVGFSASTMGPIHEAATLVR